MKSIDIVLPVLNEEEGITAFNASLFQVLEQLPDYQFQVFYIVDRGRDRTFDILRDLAARYPEITAIHLSRRFGHQMSLVAGIDHSCGDALIMMDCDNQHPPEVIPELIAKFNEGYDVVYTVRHYERGTSLSKRWTSRIFYAVQNFLSPVAIPDGTADFRLISKKVVTIFQTSVREQEQFLRGLFQWVGFRSTSLAFVSPPRFAGTTNYSVGKLIEFSVNGIVSFSRVPLRFATLLGGLISILTVVYGFVLIGLYSFGYEMPPGYASLVILVLFLSGLQLLVLGVLGEYIGSIHAEVKRRPLYIIDEIAGQRGRR